MAEVKVAPSAATQVKATKKENTPNAKKVGPTVGNMIVKAVSDSKERGGISLPAVKKILLSEGYDIENNNARVKNAVKRVLAKGTLVNSKGSGAFGSFKISKEAKKSAAKKAAAPKTKKPVVKKPPSSSAKKASPKKPTAAKKTKEAIKKAVSKKTPTKSPNKAPKPAAKKSPPKMAAKPAKKAVPKKK